MNKSASRMTFGVTCVVESIVTTHLRNPLEGNASGLNRCTALGQSCTCSAFCDISVVSNQRRQVSYCPVSMTRLHCMRECHTWAANSAKLPPLLLIEEGICRDDIIISLFALRLRGSPSGGAKV
jgi:hypothetical protein